jgi:hypothetical protein
MSESAENTVVFSCSFAALAIGLAFMAAWVTHVIVCIKTSSWILLLFGCIVAPVGIIHGIGVWFGVL